MAKVAPFHSIKQSVHHDNTGCTEIVERLSKEFPNESFQVEESGLED